MDILCTRCIYSFILQPADQIYFKKHIFSVYGESKYRVELLQDGPTCPSIPDDFFKVPFVKLSMAKRCGGKTCSMSQFLHHLHLMGKHDSADVSFTNL
jgi:hypothetical protein